MSYGGVDNQRGATFSKQRRERLVSAPLTRLPLAEFSGTREEPTKVSSGV